MVRFCMLVGPQWEKVLVKVHSEEEDMSICIQTRWSIEGCQAGRRQSINHSANDQPPMALRGCKVILVAFVWLFPTVGFESQAWRWQSINHRANGKWPTTEQTTFTVFSLACRLLNLGQFWYWPENGPTIFVCQTFFGHNLYDTSLFKNRGTDGTAGQQDLSLARGWRI